MTKRISERKKHISLLDPSMAAAFREVEAGRQVLIALASLHPSKRLLVLKAICILYRYDEEIELLGTWAQGTQ